MIPTGAELAEAIAGFAAAPSALPLQCGVQHYAWGDHRYIPALIGARNPRDLPFAELWIGAHPDLMATVQLNGCRLSLAELIAAAPTPVLGPETTARLGPELPFLLKVLAAREPLSIQAHPTRAQAVAGFQQENAIGLPLGAARRSYRDPNHKPELLVALTDFYALRGFRRLDAIEASLESTPALEPLREHYSASPDGLLALYRWLMERPQPEVNRLLQPLLEAYRQQRNGRAFDPLDYRDWMLKADRLFSVEGQHDRGLFSLLLLNLVALRPGEAIYLPAGELHAYLRGAGIELMANSNNVLRGGLTRKHIDLPSLLATLRINPGPVERLQPQPPARPGGPETYATPATEFLLERYRLEPGAISTIESGRSVRVGLVMDGQIALETEGHHPQLHLARGTSFLIPAACQTRLYGLERSLVFAASTPPPSTASPTDRQARTSTAPVRRKTDRTGARLK